MIVVLDTNVLVSGLLFGGEPRRLVDAALDGRFMLATSPHQLDELRRVLGYKKLARFVPDPEAVVSLVAEVAEVSSPAIELRLCRDPDDDHILAIVVAAAADFVVSGDDDLHSIDTAAGITVLTVSDALTALDVAPE